MLENGSPRFFRRFAEGVLDVEDLKARTHELVEFITAAATQYAFDPAHVIAIGYSNGANIAASTLLLHPRVLEGAVLLRPMLPFEPDEPPALHGVPVYIASGRRDPLIDPRDPARLATMLERFGADIELAWSAGGHALESDELNRVRTWLTRRS